jgi:hypothetical protein
MAAVRPVLPTDLAALVGSGRVYPNEAVTLDRGTSEESLRRLETAFEQWLSFATGKHTWISVRGATLRGLVSARKRGSRAAWEIDCLIDAAEDEPAVLMSLLDRVVFDAGHAGAEKIFLRVAEDSGVVPIARRCGFIPYATEVILQRDMPCEIGFANDSGLHPRRWIREDAYPTFRLYNRCTPEALRRVEGPTFTEWMAARERIGPRARQWVFSNGDRIDGWVRAAGRGESRRFEIMVAEDDIELHDAMITATLKRFHDQARLSCRTYTFATSLRNRLEQSGFRCADTFALLAKPVTRRVEEPQLAPAILA